MSADQHVHYREHQGRTIRHAWVGDVDSAPSRVHALAFTAGGRILLVGGPPGSPTGAELWLPGGGVEPGETPEQALARELLEEAAATMHALRPLGSQRLDHLGDSATPSEFHAFYWSRISLATAYAPQHEVAARHLVPPQDFLDALSWGRRSPMAAELLERALAVERALRVTASTPG